MTGIATSAEATPRWIRDLLRLLPIRSQYVVAGNIRDSFLTPFNDGATLAPLLRCLWVHLAALDYRFLLVYDPVDGLRPYPNEPAIVELATRLFDLKLVEGAMPVSLENLIAVMKKVAGLRDARCAMVVDFASRLARSPDHLDANEHRFFVAAERLSLMANPIVPKGADIATANGKARFNPVLWLANRPQDLPGWLSFDSTRVSILPIGLPDFETRERAARHLGSVFDDYPGGSPDEQRKFSATFAQLTDGLPLVAMADIAQLADRQGIGFRDVDDAVQCFKVGASENPWKKNYLRERIAGALPFIEERVRGQRPAVTKTIDILMRSVMGLTGAQARTSGNRPRGVLFFAGPTGVGKTELAKTLTQLIFGDERAYIRFDMSEFADEHTGARLLGAPPGYIGYDAGGELTNAVREKPFSVVLFDEIEKAHTDPRQVPADSRGWATDRRPRRNCVFFRGDPGVHVEPRDLRRGRARPARAERASWRPARRRRVARAGCDRRLLQVPAVAARDPESHRRQHRGIRLHHPRNRRADLRRHAAQHREPCARRAQDRVDRRTRRAAQAPRLVRARSFQRRTRHRQPARVAVRQPVVARAVRLPARRPRGGDRHRARRRRESDHDGEARMSAAAEGKTRRVRRRAIEIGRNAPCRTPRRTKEAK